MNKNRPGQGMAIKLPVRPVLRLLAAALGVLALIGGILQGGYRDTLQKAVRICLECVGIG